MGVEVLERTADCVLARCDRVLLLRWLDRVTADGVVRARAHVAALYGSHGKLVLFSLVPPRSSKPPDADAQQAIHGLSAMPTPALAGVAVVFEGGGFIAASVMALTMKLGGSGKDGTPTRVFRSMEEAVGWAEQRLGAPVPSAGELRKALATLAS